MRRACVAETFLIKVTQALVTEIEVTAVDEDDAKRIATGLVKAESHPDSAFQASVLGSWPDGEPQEADLGIVCGLELRRGWFWTSWRHARVTGGMFGKDVSFYVGVDDAQIEAGESPYEVISILAGVDYVEEPMRQYGIAARRPGDLLWFGPCKTEKRAMRMYHQGRAHLKTSLHG
ncbi:hypothetical protein D869_gp244 [Caulobacter phage CcrRogue]|uniref:Uncharacterized protein n=1 Tax=Caulobacter phage CcrRogue TaxID=2927986 RepID=K4JQV3_9CAUD|nr:hypothetical protein D869_gp244 [Caulobacter phage CcrRogue]AFU86670.1 hypothetical protein CcrRogue_gp188 [Caulobacter phage CcrRogue]